MRASFTPGRTVLFQIKLELREIIDHGNIHLKNLLITLKVNSIFLNYYL